MAFRIEKRTSALLVGLVLLAPAAFAQQGFQYEARRRYFPPPYIIGAHSWGKLTITSSGMSFDETYKGGDELKHPHVWRWKYEDIQQLKVGPTSLTVLTYSDNKWKLGADREYDFDLVSGKTFESAYEFLKGRLDQRLVAMIPGRPTTLLFEIPAKHLLRFGGDEGLLQFGPHEIVYTSEKENESRTWRYEDIENVSSAGPFQLTITTFERAKTHYGNLKGFNFELKRRLEENKFNELWLRLNQSKGLKILNSYRAAGTPQ
jgi:hypothetical protein